MGNTVNYYYIGSQGSAPRTENKITNSIQNDGDSFNPLFNFDQSFISSLKSISELEMATAQPYVSLSLLDLSGRVIDNLNLSFFHKTLDMEEISSGKRFSDRPVMSLKDIIIETDLAGGYLYYTNVVLKLRIHRPEELANSTLIGLLFPGMPLSLKYGWNTSSPDSFLGQKENLLFSIKTYNITIDEAGQIDLTVEGMAFNERFNNVLVGDDGSAIDSSLISNEEFDGSNLNYSQVKMYIDYLDSVKSRSAGSADTEIIRSLATSFRSAEVKARGRISTNFTTAIKKLLRSNKKNIKFNRRHKAISTVTFHDVVYTLCNDTFNGLCSAFPSVENFRIIYGPFNTSTPRANESLAQFPIDLATFKTEIKSFYDRGQTVPTLSLLLNMLVEKFVENEEYWKGLLGKDQDWNHPDIVVNFFNNGKTLDLIFVDAKAGLPITTSRLPKGKAALKTIRDAVTAGTNLPVIELASARSFIKKISFSQVSDQYMKAALIERMAQNRIAGPRSTVAFSEKLQAQPITPLTLPLQGSAEILGHPGWKPMRAFYLYTGIFVMDAVYKIQKVSHKLSAEGFSTNIDFMWH
jgi:hypothetical protein